MRAFAAAWLDHVIVQQLAAHQLNPAVTSYFNQVQPGLLQQSGDPVATKQMALQILGNLRGEQSSALAYFDMLG